MQKTVGDHGDIPVNFQWNDKTCFASSCHATCLCLRARSAGQQEQ